MPTARCRSAALLALVVLGLVWLPTPAASSTEDLARAALVLQGDDTVVLPLDAPMPVGATGLGPGTFLITEFGGKMFACTANWVWTDGAAHYLGAAGHCFLEEDATSSHGVDRDADVADVNVRACIAECEFAGLFDIVLSGTTVELGEVVYARQTRHGYDVGNDFGLVRIPDELVGEVRSALPVWGRAATPKDLHPADLACLYGNGLAVGETYLTKARTGAGIVTLRDGSWRAAAPTAPGDSGAAVATCVATLGGTRAVGAVGVLTHLSSAGTAGTTLAQAAKLAQEAGLTVQPLL